MRFKNGKRAKAIFFATVPDDPAGNGIHATETVSLEYESECHGDRDEIWIVEKHEGKEVARHNVKFIESIQWETANGTNT